MSPSAGKACHLRPGAAGQHLVQGGTGRHLDLGAPAMQGAARTQQSWARACAREGGGGGAPAMSSLTETVEGEAPASAARPTARDLRARRSRMWLLAWPSSSAGTATPGHRLRARPPPPGATAAPATLTFGHLDAIHKDVTADPCRRLRAAAIVCGLHALGRLCTEVTRLGEV